MAEFYRFFDSTLDDERVYTSDEFAEYFRKVLTNGVYNGGTNLQVSAGGGNLSVSVNAGFAWINGYLYKVDDEGVTLPIEPADIDNDRIDRIVIRWDNRLENRYIKAFVLKGEASEIPVPPELTRNEDVYELSLAQVRVLAGKSYVEGSQVRDERLDTEVCGLVNSLIQADTTEIFNQFNQWYDEKTAEFNINVAEFVERFNDWYTSKTGEFENVFSTWFEDLQKTGFVQHKEVEGNHFETVVLNRGLNTVESNHKAPVSITLEGAEENNQPVRNPTITVRNSEDKVVSKLTIQGYFYEGDKLEDIGGKPVKIANKKEVILDGDWDWSFQESVGNWKRVRHLQLTNISSEYTGNFEIVKHNGKLLGKTNTGFTEPDYSYAFNKTVSISISNEDSGWGDNYTPTPKEIKAYFMGWKMYTAGSANGLGTYNGTGEKRWTPIKSFDGTGYTGYIRYVPTFPPSAGIIDGTWREATNWNPYRLVYQVEEPEVLPVSTIGELSLIEGTNSVEVVEGQQSAPLETVTASYATSLGSVVTSLVNIADKHKNEIDDIKSYVDLLSNGGKPIEWHDLLLINGAEEYDTALSNYTPQIARIGNFVVIRGALKGITDANNITYAIIPEQFRPNKNHSFTETTSTVNKVHRTARWQILNGGGGLVLEAVSSDVPLASHWFPINTIYAID